MLAEVMLPELVASLRGQVRAQTSESICVRSSSDSISGRLVTLSVAVTVPLIMSIIVEEASLVSHVQISVWICERIVEVAVPHLAEQFCARCAEHFAAVPVPLTLKENVEVVNLALRGQISERICEQIVHCPFHRSPSSLLHVWRRYQCLRFERKC